MKFKKVNGLAAAVMMSLSIAAQADIITFDPTGTAGVAGDITNVGAFDWTPGSALADGVNTATGIGPAFTTYYQANLATLNDGASNPIWLNGTGGDYFTAVLGFGETSTCANASVPCNNATFTLDTTNPVNFYSIFAVGANGNNLTGAGFVGTSILSGTLVIDGFASNFALANPQSVPPQLLDQSPDNVDSWAGTTTVTGTGASNFRVRITAVDANYFPNLMVGGFITTSFFNTSQVLAFNQVDPGRCLSDGVTDCAINSDVGTFNGVPVGAGGGPDIIFQADANASFTRTVPEPATLALISLGLMGVGTFGRRRLNGK